MENVCPICERDSKRSDWYSLLPSDRAEIQNEIANLDLALESLQAEEQSIVSLTENRHLMCAMCRQLFEDIESESDRRELEERINRQMFVLESQLDNRFPGHL